MRPESPSKGLCNYPGERGVDLDCDVQRAGEMWSDTGSTSLQTEVTELAPGKRGSKSNTPSHNVAL